MRVSLPTMSVRSRIALYAGAVLCVSLAGLWWYNQTKTPPLSFYANRIVADCAKDASRLRCYDKEVPKVMSEGVSLLDSFAIIRLIQKQDPSYQFCHIAGHQISINEYSKDPTKWRDIIKECPIGICSNGCLHGALQAHFSSESISGAQIADVLPDLESVCEARPGWNPTRQQQSSCYHEMGHAALYVTGADARAAYQICKAVGIKSDGRNFMQTCSEGVFMQIFQPLEAEDFALTYTLVPRKERLSACESITDLNNKAQCWRGVWADSYKGFCNQFDTETRNACYREAWIADPSAIATGAGMVAFCSYSADKTEQGICFNKLVFSLMSNLDFNETKMKAFCMEFGSELRGKCFAHMASRMIETDKLLIDKSLDVCKQASELGIGSACYDELTYYAGFLYANGSPEKKKLCDGVPTQLQDKCMSGT